MSVSNYNITHGATGFGPINSHPGSGVESDLIIKNLGPANALLADNPSTLPRVTFQLAPGEQLRTRIRGTQEFYVDVDGAGDVTLAVIQENV